MRLWVALYGMIWLVFAEFLLGTWPSPPAAVPYLHAALGVGIVALAYQNMVWLRRTRVPGRVKRVARATFALTILMAFLGALLGADVGASSYVLGISVYEGILFFHLVNALAIITQAAAVAIAYDMWEDREFEKESEAGAIPKARAV